jgi:HPt (histidine-containing phosphotransfer) domain-containing protein
VNWDELYAALAAIAGEEEATSTEDEFQSDKQSLLDVARVEGLRAAAGLEKAATFVGNAFRSSEQTAMEIDQLQGDLPAVARLAHRLAGMAPSFGMLQVGKVSRSIEQRARAGQQVEDLTSELAEVVSATRAELIRRRMIDQLG